MIPFYEVDLREYRTTRETCCKIVHVRNWVSVVDRPFVQSAIIPLRTQCSIFFRDHVKARAPRGIRPPTDACSTHDIEVLLCYL